MTHPAETTLAWVKLVDTNELLGRVVRDDIVNTPFTPVIDAEVRYP
jgi:hypothetical protein